MWSLQSFTRRGGWFYCHKETDTGGCLEDVDGLGVIMVKCKFCWVVMAPRPVYGYYTLTSISFYNVHIFTFYVCGKKFSFLQVLLLYGWFLEKTKKQISDEKMKKVSNILSNCTWGCFFIVTFDARAVIHNKLYAIFS